MNGNGSPTVWVLLQEYSATQSGPFTSQEVISWFRRHAPAQANDRTLRTHIRGACWNVGDRSQFSKKEPFLTRVDRGLFRTATEDEIVNWRGRDEEREGPDRQDAERDWDTLTSIETAPGKSETATTPQDSEWHTEANVQALAVTALTREGWQILSVANTATKEHGIDVIASRDGQTIGIEVKGFPSRLYADPARAHEQKRTSPSTQAGHWYSQAVLAAMRLRSKHPEWRSVIALPDFPRYRALHTETAGSLAAAEIEVWWISQSGSLQGT